MLAYLLDSKSWLLSLNNLYWHMWHVHNYIFLQVVSNHKYFFNSNLYFCLLSVIFTEEHAFHYTMRHKISCSAAFTVSYTFSPLRLHPNKKVCFDCIFFIIVILQLFSLGDWILTFLWLTKNRVNNYKKKKINCDFPLGINFSDVVCDDLYDVIWRGFSYKTLFFANRLGRIYMISPLCAFILIII